jgi:NADH:ubiquinone oxidoreductase subunit 5 (subunit L)/multisubunit Na+/H+ antiporter MnhA subunit
VREPEDLPDQDRGRQRFFAGLNRVLHALAGCWLAGRLLQTAIFAELR